MEAGEEEAEAAAVAPGASVAAAAEDLEIEAADPAP